MKTTDAIRQVMKEQGVGVVKLAQRIGKKQQIVSARLTQTNVSVSVLNEMLRVLDYKVVIMPYGVTTPKGGIEIE